MIDVSTALQNILKAIYGKDVRQSIHDAIYQINSNANEALDLAEIKFGTNIVSPTSPISGYAEGTVYFNTTTGVIWKLKGGAWQQLGSMKTISGISKTGTSGNVDTYSISYNDGTTTNYTVTNGEQGLSIANVSKTSTAGNVDHYDVILSDGTTTPNGIDIANGKDGVSITNISLDSTVGSTKNYSIDLSDGTKTATGFSITDGESSYIHVRYSAQFDGQGMVATPSKNTPYIGICVTSQSTAPTSNTVYNWVKFIGDSGTGSGDMLTSDFVTVYPNTHIVDQAAALWDGSQQVSGTQLMSKSDYASKGVAGTVDKATQLVDVTNAKTADTVLLANLTDDGAGGLEYKGQPVGGAVKVDTTTITKNASNELTLASSVIAKLNNIPTVTDTYSATSSDGMSGKAVASAISGKADEGTWLTSLAMPIGSTSVSFTDTAIDNNAIAEVFYKNADGSLVGYKSMVQTGNTVTISFDSLTVETTFKLHIL